MSDKTVGEAIYHLMGWSNVDIIHESIRGFDPNMSLHELERRLALTITEVDACYVMRRVLEME